MKSIPSSKIGGALLLASALFLLGAGGGRVYRNEAMRIRAFNVSSRWESAPQAGYPNALTAYAHPDGGRIVLTGERTSARAETIISAARAALAKQGYRSVRVSDEGDRVRLEAALPAQGKLLRQIYRCAAGYCYVVTLVAPEASIPVTGRDFEEAVRSLTLIPPSEPTPTVSDASFIALDAGHDNVTP